MTNTTSAAKASTVRPPLAKGDDGSANRYPSRQTNENRTAHTSSFQMFPGADVDVRAFVHSGDSPSRVEIGYRQDGRGWASEVSICADASMLYDVLARAAEAVRTGMLLAEIAPPSDDDRQRDDDLTDRA